MEEKREATADGWLTQIEDTVREEQTEGQSVILMGHSLGGALCFIALQTERVSDLEGVVLFAPLFEVSDARSPILKPRQWFELLSPLLIGHDTIESVFAEDVGDDDEARGMNERDPFTTMNVYHELFRVVEMCTDLETTVRAPVWVLLPDDDLVVDSEATTKRVETWTPQSKVKLDVIENSGHVLPVEVRLNEFVPLFHEWSESIRDGEERGVRE